MSDLLQFTLKLGFTHYRKEQVSTFVKFIKKNHLQISLDQKSLAYLAGERKYEIIRILKENSIHVYLPPSKRILTSIIARSISSTFRGKLNDLKKPKMLDKNITVSDFVKAIIFDLNLNVEVQTEEILNLLEALQDCADFGSCMKHVICNDEVFPLFLKAIGKVRDEQLQH